VPIDQFLVPWSGEVVRHIASREGADVLDFRFAGSGPENRWNVEGERTLYLAGDEGVLIAEWARHYATERSPIVSQTARKRIVYRFSVTLDRVLDLRNSDVWNAMSIRGAPFSFVESAFARSIAHRVRTTTEAKAIMVPSIAFLDQLDRWCLVLFLEKLPEDSREYITAVEPRGFLRMDDIVE
jgi:hypothetical protein